MYQLRNTDSQHRSLQKKCHWMPAWLTDWLCVNCGGGILFIRKVLTGLTHPFHPKYVYYNHLIDSNSKGSFKVKEVYFPIGFTRQTNLLLWFTYYISLAGFPIHTFIVSLAISIGLSTCMTMYNVPNSKNSKVLFSSEQNIIFLVKPFLLVISTL